MLKVVVSTLFDCTLINRRYQAGLSLLKELQLFDLESILSLSQQQMPREPLQTVSTAAGTVWQ